MSTASVSDDKYDFKNAPEGTTHFNPETAIAAKCWVKIENGVVYFRYSTNNSWYYWFDCNEEGRKSYISSFVEIKSSGKEDFPQITFTVGDNCEAYHEVLCEWCSVGILAQHPTNKEAYACMNLSNNTLFWSDTFRPLKTQEEIEREEAIAEMRDDILNHAYTEVSLEEYLIDLGWGKK